MALSKKQIQEKDLKAILSKQLGNNNPIFSPGHLTELHQVFSLYSDPRIRRADIRDILLTANSLGLESRYEVAIRILEEILEENQGNTLDYEGFVKQLTRKIGNPFTEEGRKATFDLIDYERKGEIEFKDLKQINDKLGYGYSELELLEIIHAVGGYNNETISYEKFTSHIKRKLARRQQDLKKIDR